MRGNNRNRNQRSGRNVVEMAKQIEIQIEKKMSLGHEKLDVYRLSIEYVAWVYAQSLDLNGIHRHARDQWLRASQSIPLNIAEGNGKTAQADRRKYFEIARGSALECAAIQDVLRVGDGLDEVEHQKRKAHLDRIATMLSKLGGRGFIVGEEQSIYGRKEIDFDGDLDLDLEKQVQNKPVVLMERAVPLSHYNSLLPR